MTKKRWIILGSLLAASAAVAIVAVIALGGDEDSTAPFAAPPQGFGKASEELQDCLAEQGVEAASLLVGSSRIELLASTGGDTPIARFLAKRGPGMHHIALETDRLVAEGFGETRPVQANNTKRGKEQNRRVEFVIVDTAPPE